MNGPPRLLLIDTSGRGGFVAVALGDRLLDERRLDDSRRHARDLAPFSAELLKAQGWTPRMLDGVVVGLGPGSYTGLRVGLMSAKVLAHVVGCALIGVETFAVIAAQADVESVDVIADAQQGKVYVQSFRRDTEPTALCIRPIDDWLADRAATHVSGPGVDAHSIRISHLPTVEPSLRVPTPAGMLNLGLTLFESGRRDDVLRLEPIYLRPSAAEEQWARRDVRAEPRPSGSGQNLRPAP